MKDVVASAADEARRTFASALRSQGPMSKGRRRAMSRHVRSSRLAAVRTMVTCPLPGLTLTLRLPQRSTMPNVFATVSRGGASRM